MSGVLSWIMSACQDFLSQPVSLYKSACQGFPGFATSFHKLLSLPTHTCHSCLFNTILHSLCWIACRPGANWVCNSKAAGTCP